MRLLLRWLVSAAAVYAAAFLVPGIRLEEGFTNLLIVALVVGLVNALVRPILRMLACGLIVLTLGLFLLVINAAMLLLTGWLAGKLDVGFSVTGFWTAVGGAIVVTLVTWVVDGLIGQDRDR